MKLRRALQDCRESLRRYLAQTFPAQPQLTLLIRQMQQGDNILRSPQGQNLKQLHNTLIAAVEAKHWKSLSERDWRRAPWVLWYGPQRQHLAANAAFMKQLYKQAATQPVLLKRLIRVYLRDFGKAGCADIGQFIQQQLTQLQTDSTLQRWQHNSALFDADNGVQQLAVQCLTQPAESVLLNAGLQGELLSGGFSTAVYQHGLQQVSQALANGDTQQLTALLDWSVDSHRLRYTRVRRDLANALLLPWLDTDPNMETRLLIQEFLLTYFRDPRVSTAYWQGVKRQALLLFYRWLVGATLETFFNILDQLTLDQHWRYRRSFWWAYYEQGYIDEAWLALGKATQKFLAERPDLARSLKGSFGVLTGRGINTRQTVLMFRIKSLIVAEWSHSGKCHIWHSNNPDSPPLYLEEYQRKQITQRSERIKPGHRSAGISHYGNETGSWQNDVAHFITEHTQIQIESEAYMPKAG